MLRAAPRLREDQPDVIFSRMPDVFRSPLLDRDVLQAGWDLIGRMASISGGPTGVPTPHGTALA